MAAAAGCDLGIEVPGEWIALEEGAWVEAAGKWIAWGSGTFNTEITKGAQCKLNESQLRLVCGFPSSLHCPIIGRIPLEGDGIE